MLPEIGARIATTGRPINISPRASASSRDRKVSSIGSTQPIGRIRYRNLSGGIAAIHSGWTSERSCGTPFVISFVSHLRMDTARRGAGTTRHDPTGACTRLAARFVLPFRDRRYDRLRPGERLAAALNSLGPSFIKFGQSLATRSDLIGEEQAHDLSSCRTG